MTARDQQLRNPHGAPSARPAADADTGAAATTPPVSTTPSTVSSRAPGGIRGRPIARSPWRPPTRRSFVAMIGAAAASLVVRKQMPDASISASIAGADTAAGADTPVASSDRARPRPAHGTTRWIGHC